MKFKPGENLPASATAILTSAGHDVDTVTHEGLTGAPDQDVVATATAAGRILISLDRGLGDIRAYPPASHAGIVVLRLTDQPAAAATKAVSDLVPDQGSLRRALRHGHRIAAHTAGISAPGERPGIMACRI